MGLLDKALRERKAGHPPKGTGLFVKALSALEQDEVSPAPPAPKPAAKPSPKPAAKPSPKPAAKPSPAAKPEALPEAAKPAFSAATEAVPPALDLTADLAVADIDESELQGIGADLGAAEISAEVDLPATLDFDAEIETAVEDEELPPPPLSAIPAGNAPESLEPPAFDPKAFPFTAAEISSLTEELTRLPEGADDLVAAYARIAEALPLGALALLFSEDEGIRVAASYGFSFRADRVGEPTIDAVAASLDGKLCGLKTRDLLESLVETDLSVALRASVSLDVEGEPKALWLYADARLDGSSPELVEAVAELFAARALRAAPLPERGDPEAALLRSGELGRGEGHAVVAVFELASYIDYFEFLVPGLRRAAVEGAVRGASLGMLGPRGEALVLPGERFVIFLYSPKPLDPELALVQFGKSLRRALPFFGSAEPPEGKALGLDLAYEGARGLLERFLAD